MSEKRSSIMNLMIHGQLTQIQIHPGIIEGTLDLDVGGRILTVERSVPFQDLISDLEGFLDPSSAVPSDWDNGVPVWEL